MAVRRPKRTSQPEPSRREKALGRIARDQSGKLFWRAQEAEAQARALAREAAERRRAQEDFDRLFEISHDLLCIAGFDGRFKRLNPAWERTLGFSRDELLARPYLDFVHPDDHAATRAEAARIAAGATSVFFENRYATKDGAYRWLHWTAVPHVEAGLVYCVARDATQRKKVEELKTELIAVVNHELRTPLTAIRGALALALDDATADLGPTRELLQIAHDNSLRLARLVDDMLDLQKLEAGKLAFEPRRVDARDLATAALAANRAYGVTLSVGLDLAPLPPSPLVVLADPDRVAQVLANLISNAMKHSPEGEDVTIALATCDDAARFEVRDCGPGIPASFRDRIFEKFAQSEATKGGTGLGLSICKGIVERLGGRIGYETAEGVGTTFWFELPLVD